jgi:hypothetical protein
MAKYIKGSVTINDAPTTQVLNKRQAIFEHPLKKNPRLPLTGKTKGLRERLERSLSLNN